MNHYTSGFFFMGLLVLLAKDIIGRDIVGAVVVLAASNVIGQSAVVCSP